MPGLLGFYCKENQPSLDEMICAMRYKEWYNVDRYDGPNVKIGRVHVGVLNPEPQPIFNEERNVLIFMDGEIYDYDEEREKLKQKGHVFNYFNDPEFLLHMFEEYGTTFIQKLNGSFSAAIFDMRNQDLFLLTDRFATRPVYYYHNKNRLIFASEIKAILQDRKIRREINWDSVADFFTFEFIIGNKTIIKNINLLPPASILSFNLKKNRFKILQYWELKYDENYSHNEEWYANELYRRFKNAVKRRMTKAKTLGLFLSGGIDSRAILAACTSPKEVRTYSLGESHSREVSIARKVAKIAGVKNEFLQIDRTFHSKYANEAIQIGEGMLNLYHFHPISVLNEIKEEIIFHGLAQDVMFGGIYLPRKKIRVLGENVPLPWISNLNRNEIIQYIYKDRNTLFTEEELSQLFSKDIYAKIKGKALNSIKEAVNAAEKNANLPPNIIDHVILNNRVRRWTSIWSACIRSVLEDRVPAFDNELIDLYLQTPPKFRFNHRIYVKALRKMNPKLAKVIYNKTGVPANTPSIFRYLGNLFVEATRKLKIHIRRLTKGAISIPIKSGYPDYDEWLRKIPCVRNFVIDTLFDKRTLDRGYFNEEYLKKMVNDHMASKRDLSYQLLALVTFELFLRTYIDEANLSRMPKE